MNGNPGLPGAIDESMYEWLDIAVTRLGLPAVLDHLRGKHGDWLDNQLVPYVLIPGQPMTFDVAGVTYLYRWAVPDTEAAS